MFQVRPPFQRTAGAMMMPPRRIRRKKLTTHVHQLRNRCLLPTSQNGMVVSSSQHRFRHHDAHPQTHPHHHSNSTEVDYPTRESLRQYFIAKAVPMVGFGIMDQTIMLQAGNAIDCTMGVALGLSTLSAAAFGQIVSNAGSVLFGGAVERAAHTMGFPTPHFTAAQKQLPVVQRTALAGTLFGVILGCTLGLVNLLFIDTCRTQERKMAAASPLSYEIEASNKLRSEATVITVRGPDREGLLAAITKVFRDENVCLVEVSARRSKSVIPRGDEPTTSRSYLPYTVEDVFVVQADDKQLSDDRLQHVLQALQNAVAWVMPPNPVIGNPTEQTSTSPSDGLRTLIHT